jgi:superfamily II DNA/RNA helicase
MVRDALRTLLARNECKNGIVFANRKTTVALRKIPEEARFSVALCGDMDQSARLKMLRCNNEATYPTA